MNDDATVYNEDGSLNKQITKTITFKGVGSKSKVLSYNIKLETGEWVSVPKHVWEKHNA